MDCKTRTTAIALAVGCLTTPVVIAQEDSDVVRLEEIVVTAQFRPEDFQDAAVAIDVVTTRQMERAGITSAAQLTNIVPALQISNGGTGTQAYYLRGVGNTTPTSLVDPGVAFNVDGVYIGRPTSIRNTFFDLARIEVLKGPQGTLYGRNSTGGAINVIPVRPQLGETNGYVVSSLGNYDAYGIQAALNLDISDTVAARISATRNEHDGYLSDGTANEDGYAVRAQLLVEPSDQLSMRFSTDFAHDGGAGAGGVISGYLDTFSLNPVDDPLPRDIGYLAPESDAIFESLYSFTAGRFGEGIDSQPFTDNDYLGTRAEFNWDSSAGVLTSIVSYRESELNSLDTANGIPALSDQDDSQFSLEARLAGPEGGLVSYLVGAYYFDEDIETDYFFNVQSLGSSQHIEITTESAAVFGRLTIAPTDKFRIVTGLRYTDETKKFTGSNDVTLPICTLGGFPLNQCPDAMLLATPSAPRFPSLVSHMGLVDVSGGNEAAFILPGGAANVIYVNNRTLLDEEASVDKLTWRAGIELDVGLDSLLYASVETGYHAGGFSFSDFVPEFGPEEVTAFTLGSKNRFVDDRLQVNLELFYWTFDDQQVSHFADDGLGNLSFVTENAGKSTNYGAELSLLYKPTANTILSGDFHYLKAEYDEFTYLLPAGPSSPPPVTGCPFTPSPQLANQVLVDCSGFDALRAPEWTINVGIEHAFPIGDNYELVANVDAKYQSSAMIGFEMLPGVSEENSYTLTDVSLMFRPTTDRWSVAAFARNLGDERPIGGSFFNNQFNVFGSSPLPPKTYGIRALIEF